VSEREKRWYLDGVGAFMGFRFTGVGEVRLDVRPELLNPGGLLSGAVSFALVDYAMGSAVWAETSENEGIATQHVSLNFLATVGEGEVICRAHVDRRNRNAAALRADVTGADGTLLAAALGSYAIFPIERYLGRPRGTLHRIEYPDGDDSSAA
jgi:uncharacterized protein (TIGR00369 family)